ncbi:hypothetical protein M0L20_02660 [Spirosoma sp. RP8]|uniref:Uncharacterized protein n=2 Tax=Spirosoma liriopis TaxID=2937440 RepID=A0ABT0HFG9_9BACT|nr:hypothetical protein [Spirosoma liriopis]
MIKPDLPTLTAFVLDKGGTKLMADEMFYFYTSKGWMVGKSPTKDWNAAARNWISRSKSTESAQAPQKKLIV